MCTGAYLLSIAWGGYQIPGSPFKVNVGCCNDASKVTVTGKGLEGGALGQDLCVTVDTRRAGCGTNYLFIYLFIYLFTMPKQQIQNIHKTIKKTQQNYESCRDKRIFKTKPPSASVDDMFPNTLVDTIGANVMNITVHSVQKRKTPN